jgi:hypothetical protein
MKFFNFFLFRWLIFALLDPDPDSESPDLIESGYETLHEGAPYSTCCQKAFQSVLWNRISFIADPKPAF